MKDLSILLAMGLPTMAPASKVDLVQKKERS